MPPVLSIIVPFYNEKGGLPDTVASLEQVSRKIGVAVEVLLVDDGSTDESTGGLEMPDGFRVLRHRTNMGYGRAITTGLTHCRGEWVAIIDADGTYAPDDIPKLWERREDGEMIVGLRQGGDARSRRFVKWFLRALAQSLSGQKIPDLNSGLRVFRRDLALSYKGLFPAGFSLTTTLTLAFLCHGYQVEYVPIEYHPRVGSSKIKPVKDTYNFFSLILRMIMFFNPLKILLPVSIAFFALATAWLLVSRFVFGELMDVTVTVLYMLSVQIALLGFLGDLIVRRSQ